MRSASQKAWTIAIAVPAVFVIAVVSLSAVLSSGFGFGSMFPVTGRKHLEPIAIAAAACPYVRVMHQTANELQSAEPLFGGYIDWSDPDGTAVTPTWPQVRARVKTALMHLELAILVSRPHFPRRVQRQLTITLDAIHTGRRQLARSHNALDLENKTQNALDTGQTAFGYASDLVGKQCRYALGADSHFAQAITTTTLPPRRRTTPGPMRRHSFRRS